MSPQYTVNLNKSSYTHIRLKVVNLLELITELQGQKSPFLDEKLSRSRLETARPLSAREAPYPRTATQNAQCVRNGTDTHFSVL